MSTSRLKRPAARQQAGGAALPRRTKLRSVLNTPPTAILDVFAFGNGEGGELGLGPMIKKKRDPTMAEYPVLNDILSDQTAGVVQVSVGGMHSVALTRDGEVVTWGVNDNKALGRPTEWREPPEGNPKGMTDLNPFESTPAVVSLDALAPSPPSIVQVAACDNATFTLASDGRVYGWGTFLGSDGPFGFLADSIKDKGKPKAKERIQVTPTLIPGLAGDRDLACGANHALALTHAGKAYTWGSGEQGELGRRLIPRRRFHSLIPEAIGFGGRKIERVYAGFHHNFAIDESGRVYAWGLNNYGQTGLPTSDDELVVGSPTIVKSLEQFRIRHLAAGSQHSLACTEDGQILAWGRCDDCQMGISLAAIPPEHLTFDSAKRPRIVKVPTLVPGVHAKFVAAGIDNSMAISNDGQVYAWGFSSDYRTGLGTEDSVRVPTLLNGGDILGREILFVGYHGQFSVATGPICQPLKK